MKRSENNGRVLDRLAGLGKASNAHETIRDAGASVIALALSPDDATAEACAVEAIAQLYRYLMIEK